MKVEAESALKNVKLEVKSALKNVKVVLTYDINCIKMSMRSNENEKEDLSKVNRVEK